MLFSCAATYKRLSKQRSNGKTYYVHQVGVCILCNFAYLIGFGVQ